MIGALVPVEVEEMDYAISSFYPLCVGSADRPLWFFKCNAVGLMKQRVVGHSTELFTYNILFRFGRRCFRWGLGGGLYFICQAAGKGVSGLDCLLLKFFKLWEEGRLPRTQQ